MRAETEPEPNQSESNPEKDRSPGVSRLLPSDPPGRLTRKARRFAAEIARLRQQGYTLGAIQQALADAGVCVSLSTVWREAGRMRERQEKPMPPSAAKSSATSTPSPTPAAETEPPMSSAVAHPSPLPPLARRTGKEIAEAFTLSHHTNPLFRAKEQQ